MCVCVCHFLRAHYCITLRGRCRRGLRVSTIRAATSRHTLNPSLLFQCSWKWVCLFPSNAINLLSNYSLYRHSWQPNFLYKIRHSLATKKSPCRNSHYTLRKKVVNPQITVTLGSDHTFWSFHRESNSNSTQIRLPSLTLHWNLPIIDNNCFSVRV